MVLFMTVGMFWVFVFNLTSKPTVCIFVPVSEALKEAQTQQAARVGLRTC